MSKISANLPIFMISHNVHSAHTLNVTVWKLHDVRIIVCIPFVLNGRWWQRASKCSVCGTTSTRRCKVYWGTSWRSYATSISRRPGASFPRTNGSSLDSTKSGSTCWSSFTVSSILCRDRNKPKLPLVRRISDMLQTTCPPTCPLVQVLVRFVGPKLDALDRQNSGQYKGRHGSHSFFSEVFELEIVIINAKIMYWAHFPDLFRVSVHPECQTSWI